MKILVNLIGGQSFPNYYVAQKFKVDKILNLYSKDSENSLNNLKEAIKKNSLCDQFEELECNAFSIPDVREKCETMVRKNPGCKFTLNYTGGTKQMSIGAYKHFEDIAEKLVYVDSQYHYFLITSEDGTQSMEKLDVSIDVDTYLILSGFSVKSIIDDKSFILKRKDITKALMQLLRETRDKKGFDGVMKLKNNFSSNVGSKIINNWKNEKEKYFLNCNDEKSYFSFGSGGWFEEWTYLKLLEEKNKYDNIEINLKSLENEFDVFAIQGGILHLYECKTSFNIENNDILKLYANSKRYGGKYGNGFLVCFTLRTGLKTLAKNLGLQVLEALNGEDFKSIIEKSIIKSHL